MISKQLKALLLGTFVNYDFKSGENVEQLTKWKLFNLLTK